MAELHWHDPAEGRELVLERDAIAGAPAALAERGWERFELLATERSLALAPALAERAAGVHLVPPGLVSEASATILDAVSGPRLVALGGGRVIDSAKAIAAVRGGEVAALPTTLAGSPINRNHQLPAGQDERERVRPGLVLADPEAMTSAPEELLRASAINALAHGADSLYTPRADGISRGAALAGATLIARSLDAPRSERDRSELALGALLCATGIDRAGVALHHVLSQTVVRVCRLPHARTHASLLPHTMEAMRARAPEEVGALAFALGVEPAAVGRRIAELGRVSSLSELGAERSRVGEILDLALSRPELEAMTPGEVRRGDLEAILDAAW